MGICSSCQSTAVATAKLILTDGTLQEYTYPVRVSYVLQKNPSVFICNSDEMEFDDVVSAVRDEDVLQPGQLYFALPLSRLRRPLGAEEMAALAVKASSALAKRCGGKCGSKNVFFTGVNVNVKSSERVSDVGSNGRSGRRRNFSALSAIPE